MQKRYKEKKMKFEIKNYKKENSWEAEIIVGKKDKYKEFGFKSENEETLLLVESQKFIIAIDKLDEENNEVLQRLPKLSVRVRPSVPSVWRAFPSVREI